MKAVEKKMKKQKYHAWNYLILNYGLVIISIVLFLSTLGEVFKTILPIFFFLKGKGGCLIELFPFEEIQSQVCLTDNHE